MATTKKPTVKKTKTSAPKATAKSKKETKKQSVFEQNEGMSLKELMAKAQLETSEKKRITITLTENQAKALKILAEGHNCTVGSLIGNDMLISFLFYNKDDMAYLTAKDSELATQVVVGN